jgi:hypothetical protein
MIENDIRYHYVYLITNSNIEDDLTPIFYIGVRSSTCKPHEDDEYFGSSKYLNEDIDIFGIEHFNKKILEVFETREGAMEYERFLHEYYKVDINPIFYNRVISPSEKFCFNGNHTKETIDIIKEKRQRQEYTDEQRRKFQDTWHRKTDKEREEYSTFRKRLWEERPQEVKEEFSLKISEIVKSQWDSISPEKRKERSEKTLETKANRSEEEKKKEFERRSISQKRSKNRRTPEEIKNTSNKRKETYQKMSEERKKLISDRQSKSMKGRKWFNNGKISKMFFTDDVPDGFVQGRLK